MQTIYSSFSWAGVFFLVCVWRYTVHGTKILSTTSSPFENKALGNPQVFFYILFLCMHPPTFTPGFVTTGALEVLSNLEGGSNLNQNEEIAGEKTSKII